MCLSNTTLFDGKDMYRMYYICSKFYTYLYHQIKLCSRSTYTPIQFIYEHNGDDEPYDDFYLTSLPSLYILEELILFGK